MRIVVVGLGPGGADLMSKGALAALDPSKGSVFLRTARHPAATGLRATRTFDDLYETATDRAEVYSRIAEELVAAALDTTRNPTGIAYAVPGSPVVAEESVLVLRRRAAENGIEVELVPGLSFLDLAWSRLGVDPVAASVRLVDGGSFATQAAGQRGPLLVSHCWNREILSRVKLAVADPRPSMTAWLLWHLGLPDEVVAEVAWSDIDRTVEADHLTSLYVPVFEPPVAGALADLQETTEMLRAHCPWDREQDHRSLARHLLEETYETIEALERLPADPSAATAEQAEHLEEELGDLLFQVFFHALLAREEGLFALDDVAATVNEKLVSRHPHVFGDVVAETAEAVLGNWERMKHHEKGRSHLFEGVPAALPALAKAAKFERKLESLGLGLAERELAPPKDSASAEQAAGDEILSLARRVAAAGLDPEAALRSALDRLAERVRWVEDAAASDGRSSMLDIPRPRLLDLWRESSSHQ